MVGGGEILRDEQIYLAHKCADPKSYLPPEHLLNERDWAQIERYKPTDVQLQVWDDLCHVAPTLSFTRPAKYMYRSVAQFSAWALARAQKTEIEILDDDEISDISQSESETEGQAHGSQVRIGKAGDPLPRFRNHMVRQRVSRHGEIYVLAPASELAGCSMSRGDVGVVKALTVSKWLGQNREWDRRFRQAKSRIHKRRLKEVSAGYEIFEQGDVPPPSALAGRRKIGAVSEKEKKRARSMGLALWSVWGSKHDEVAVQREEKADKEEPEVISATGIEGQGARSIQGIEKQTNHPIRPPLGASTSRSRYRRRLVRDESQAEEFPDENTAVEGLLALRREQSSPTGHPISGESSRSGASLLTPTYRPNTGVSGKRPRIDGIAVPFSLGKEADTASMLTLTSAMDQNTYPPTPHPMSPTEPLTSAKTDKQVGTSQPNPRPACSATPATSITDDRQVAPSRPVSAANGTAAPTGSSIKVDHGDEHDSAEEHQKHEDPDALGEGTASPLFM